METRIVLADDHAMFRDGLRQLIHSESRFRVVGEACDAMEAVRTVQEHRPDILLLDLAMPGGSGLETIRLLADEDLPTGIIVLTASIGRMETVQAVQLGARGVVLKAEASDRLLEAIGGVVGGKFWLRSQSLPDQESVLREALKDDPGPPREFELTPRERLILAALTEGLSNRDLAEKFNVSEVTVKHHLNSIFTKCGMSNRLELALFALRRGLARL